MSIDIEECKQMANRLQSMEPRPFSVDARAIELFPRVLDELIRCKQRPEQTTILFSGLDPGDMLRAAQEFEAEEARKKRDQEPPAFAIGDRVRIKHPLLPDGFTGEFIISQIDGGKYSHCGHPWYPASSLELVEELKIGDEVEAAGPDVDGRGVGLKFKINDTSERWGEKVYSGYNVWYYPASSLKKIQPNQTIAEAQAELQANLDEATQAIREILAPLVDERLQDIEEQLTDLLADYREEKQKRLDMLDRIKEIEEESSSQHCQTQVLMTAQARTDRRISGMVERLTKIESAMRSV